MLNHKDVSNNGSVYQLNHQSYEKYEVEFVEFKHVNL